MRAVVDTSTLVSLARAGLLGLLERSGLELVILEVVVAEAVTAGLAGRHTDAAAIETALTGRPVTVAPQAQTTDAAVLLAAIDAGLLLSNDLALGRRARNSGVLWLRTADLVILAFRSSRFSAVQARAAVQALHHAGRLTGPLADAYLEELS